jgi:hypothetical protein
MKKLLFLLFAVVNCVVLNAQVRYKVTSVMQRIQTTDYWISVQKMNTFITSNNITVSRQNESPLKYTVNFSIEPKLYAAYKEVVKDMGLFTENNLNTTDNTARVEELKGNIKYYQDKIDLQSSLMEKMDPQTEQYKTMWGELKNLETSIRSSQTDLNNLTSTEYYYVVDLEIEDETYTPQNSSVQWINMPGVEYSYLQIEEPQDTLSSPYYQGVFLKYVFTKGKSFATLGAYKTTNKLDADTMHYSEMFVFGFGQDFYSRHLGRGSKKFFNLYSGYTLGGMLASNDKRKENFGYIAPAVGLEIFKNKYVLIDTKVNYMVPFKNTRQMRGLAFNMSFNFVF